MNKRGVWILIAVALKVIGLVILVSSLRMTSNAVAENLGKAGGSIIGMVFIIAGLIILTNCPE